LETTGVEDIFQLLQCNDEGLTKIVCAEWTREKHVNPFLQVESFLLSLDISSLSFDRIPVSEFYVEPSVLAKAAALVAIALSNGQNSVRQFNYWILRRANGNSVKALIDSLAPIAKVKHDGKWVEIEAFHLVPGDVISFKIGDIVPVDCRLIEPVNISIDQAAQIGECLLQGKKVGDECFS
jgi:H+-transporting ATPase